MIRSLLALAASAILAPAARAENAPVAAPAPDFAALIECRQDIAAYARGVVPLLSDPAAAKALGWETLPRSNPFMVEFRLPAPIAVFGTSSDRVTITGGTIMVLLDAPDPRTLARTLKLETGVDTPDKFMAGREIASRDIVTPGTGEKMIESVILSVSDVHSHPGKTLAGCTYDLDQP